MPLYRVVLSVLTRRPTIRYRHSMTHPLGLFHCFFCSLSLTSFLYSLATRTITITRQLRPPPLSFNHLAGNSYPRSFFVSSLLFLFLFLTNLSLSILLAKTTMTRQLRLPPISSPTTTTPSRGILFLVCFFFYSFFLFFANLCKILLRGLFLLDSFATTTITPQLHPSPTWAIIWDEFYAYAGYGLPTLSLCGVVCYFHHTPPPTFILTSRISYYSPLAPLFFPSFGPRSCFSPKLSH